MNSKSIPVYADHAATTPLKPEALEAMLPWFKVGFGNPSSLHSFGQKARKAVEEARTTIAECIHARPEEIFFTSGGTEANNWVVKGSKGGLLVSSYEHHSVLNAAKSERKRGRIVSKPSACRTNWRPARSASLSARRIRKRTSSASLMSSA